MAELEASIEKKFIEQLCCGDSQWTYRPELKTEKDLWDNFRYILEQNNKAKLKDIPISDSEFEQIKNQLHFSSFYDAGKWLVGENGIVYVHVQRENETMHLMVMNQEHISGGSSVYEVINQYQALKELNEETTAERDRRFDVSLLINGIPLIHIELKNREHSYMDGFRQIKKYIGEGKFRGIFSAVQMFVVSNAADTRYFSAARDTELNSKFISCWLDEENKPVPNYLDFARSVLKIPEAHEMISKYTVLDNDAKRLLLLRPYQIHAIEAIRRASKKGESGFVWHTTGSGKTMTSYKATRNLLMDIPSIEKTIFLIDRKDLDTQTKMAFQSYADNDLIDVDETDNVTDLNNKLSNDNRQMIVTTIQKMQTMMHRRLSETHPKYAKIKGLRVAFVVDECHRAVTPATKREFEKFFYNSLWYGFTGTPRFPENPYPEMGDLPRTTEQLYGRLLHSYTIKEAIHDEAVLGFMTEYLVDKGIDVDAEEENDAIYDKESHMLAVLDTVLNKSREKLGLNNGKGQTYEALLTVKSIERAQKYYELLTKVKKGQSTLKISEEVTKVLPDFPKFAITYSISENEEDSKVNQDKMQVAIDDYNAMFGTKYQLSQIAAYNRNLNDRLARKMDKYKSRDQQLDLVIVVDRLLTGFDAPCLSTLFIDRQPMSAHDIIQAFSRTNRIFNTWKKYGQIVTFQSPKKFKEAVDSALKLFSAGGMGEALAKNWDEVEQAFIAALADLRCAAKTPAVVPSLSKREKKNFVVIFQRFDSLLAQLRSFTNFEGKTLEDYQITELEYEEYAAHYRNVIEEIYSDSNDSGENDGETDGDDGDVLNTEYELLAYSHVKIDYDYIISLIQNIVSSMEDDAEDEETRQKRIKEIREYIDELSKDNDKLGNLMRQILDKIIENKEAYRGENVSLLLENMRQEAMTAVVTNFAKKWFVDEEAVMYAVQFHRNGEVPNANLLKDSINYVEYKENTDNPLPKFKCRSEMIAELEKVIETEIIPLQQR